MVKWVALVVIIAIGAAVYAYLLTRKSPQALLENRKGTVYVMNDHGYSAFTNVQPTVHETNHLGLVKVIQRYMKGDLYDSVGVSTTNSLFDGLIVDKVDGATHVSITFKTASEPQELAAFRTAMTHFGFPVEENSNNYSGGSDAAHQITTVEFTLPADAEKIVQFVEAALAQVYGKDKPTFYVNASLLADGPVGKSGTFFEPDSDPLSQVL